MLWEIVELNAHERQHLPAKFNQNIWRNDWENAEINAHSSMLVQAKLSKFTWHKENSKVSLSQHIFSSYFILVKFN